MEMHPLPCRGDAVSLSPEDKKRIGGSDVASVLGISRYGGPLVPYLRIVEGVEKDETEAMESGRDLELPVLTRYRRRTGHDMQTDFSVRGLPEHERASLDAIAYPQRGTWRVVEAKTASWRVMSDWGEPGTDQIPQEYLVQVQWYLGAIRQDPRAQCIDNVADVPALVGGEFGIWQVRYDPEVYEALREGVKRFWMDHVVPRRPPEPTGATAEGEFIRKRFPRHTANALDVSTLDPAVLYTLDEHRRAVTAAKEAQKAREKWDARVQMLLGEHEGVVGFGDGSRLTWRQNKPSTVTDWEAVARDLGGRYYSARDRAEGEFEALVKQHTTQVEGARPLVWREGKKR
jgi:predicted phage-related endonuclease